MKIAIAAALSVVALTLGACKDDPHTLTSDELSRANTGAREYAVNAGDTFLGCNGTDSPPIDGHTTCTIKTKAGPNYALQCSYKATGCKPK